VWCLRFNPRAREGRDADSNMLLTEGETVSIHAPAKGATPGNRRRNPEEVVSIHAPAKGATPAEAGPYFQTSVSIHAPAKGATDRHRKR